jgi:hypothetical protein
MKPSAPYAIRNRLLRGGKILLAFLTVTSYAQLNNSSYAPGQLAHVPGEPIVVNRFGVYPKNIIRKQGPFILMIENRLPGHTAHYSLTLDQGNGGELVGFDTAPGRFRISRLLDLKPNNYVLRFPNTDSLFVTIQIQ